MQGGIEEELLRAVAEKRGLILEASGPGFRLRHPEAPLFIEVRRTSRGILVRLGYESLRDYIRDVVDTETDPRGVVEELVDELAMTAYELAEQLRGKGHRVVLDTRTAAMDVLGELEEAEEE